MQANGIESTKDEKSYLSSSDFLHNYLKKTNLSDANTLNRFVEENQIQRDDHETDEAFTKRVKKINYLNLAQQLIRQSNRRTSPKILEDKPVAPLKRMKPVFSPAEDPDFDDEYEIDDRQSRDIFDRSSSSSSSSDEDEEIHPYSHRTSVTGINTTSSTHNFANDIKQKLSNLAADVVRTFGNSNNVTDEDLTKPLSSSNSFSSRLFSSRNRDMASNNSENSSVHEPPVVAETEEKEEQDADLLYTNESLLPQVDWENLERQLKQAQLERERYDKARLNDRDEIRRKLAAGNESEDDNEDYYTSNYLKKTINSTPHRRRQGSNLQICFVNEHHQTVDSIDAQEMSKPSESQPSASGQQTEEDILSKQQRLQEEAKVALVLGAKMARMQVQIERRALRKKKSPLFDMIGISTQADKPLTSRVLEDMNIGQLQVIVNDLHSQIEAHNEELVKLLMERDSLSMEQDSILVDIEDLTKRLQECAASRSSESKRTTAASQRVYLVKSNQPPAADVQKKSLLHNLLRKATFI